MTIEYIPAKTIVTRTKSAAWFGAEYNMNIYKGCCHGCIYCDSRGDCYQVKEFDRVRAKENCLEIIRNDLRRKVKRGVIATGAMSDPYNPVEADLELTRKALTLVDAYQFGAAIATKSDLVVRDADILREIAGHSPVIVKVTITTPREELAAKLEPRAPSVERRFEAVRRLGEAGVYAGILLMPVVPFLEDKEEDILFLVERAAAAGARFIYPAFGMTMRDGQREYFLAKLEEAFPGQGLAERYLRRYGQRYECPSPRAKALWRDFAAACGERGILCQMRDIIRSYRQGYSMEQLSLF